MNGLIPNRQLIDLEFELAYRAKPITIDGRLSSWTDRELLPTLSALDGQFDFGRIWACWNEQGLYIACQVQGKKKPLYCVPKAYWNSDNLRLCTDMRDTRTIKRASRYCQQFFFLPSGGGKNGNQPVAGIAKIKRAREDAPTMPTGQIQIAAKTSASGYSLEAHIPASCLSGFDPIDHSRIGFYYILEDRELGQQYLTVGDDLNWHIDPSTWPTAVLNKPRR